MEYVTNLNNSAMDPSLIVNSSASFHITFDRSAYVTYTTPSGSSVVIATTVKAQLCERGDVLFQVTIVDKTRICRFQINFNVPGSAYFLLSASTKNLKAVFPILGKKWCVITNEKKTVLNGSLEGSLYAFGKQSAARLLDVTSTDFSIRWQERSPHVNEIGILQVL